MKNPMDLKNLPKYLKELRENKSYDENLVVDMGHIVVENSYFSKKLIFTSALLLLLGVGSIISYNLLNKDTITLSVKGENIQIVSEIISNSGAKIVSAKETEGSKFEIKIYKVKDLSSFLEKLRKNKNIELN